MHGYSSSEESDDDRRPRPPPASGSSTDQKKAKKKKPTPQQAINHTWKRFQNKKFNKALAVLPFDPVPAPASADKPNELLTGGYERAVEECRRKVEKIIKECRRVNMRYRDPGFDLDWDLKWEKGYCLNTLGEPKWRLSRSTLSNPNASVPKAVKRVHEIFEKPTFMKKIDGGDIKQGSIGDCWLMASLTALASVEGGLERVCVAYDTRIGIYGFVFYRDGDWIYSIIDDKLYLKSPCWDSPSLQRDLLQQIDREDVERVYRKTYQTGSKALFFSQCKNQNETWVPLLEKAYAKAHGDFASLAGGWIGEGLEDLTGGVTTELLTSDILDIEGFWDNELSKVNEEFLFGCSTGLLDGGYGERDGISEGHAYVIMEARTLKSGERLIKLRNPWGKIRKGLWEGAWSDGSKEWTTEVQEELGHHFGNDSVFWINYEDFLSKYQHIDRTRLFRDPAWRCTQRWIGVEVPWKSQFNEKFQVKLSKDGPLVLVLSQLDTRYFKGLQGQYTFRIHFRIHERSRPGAEDYIVRSHGNYLMERSVSIELPDMPAGEYSVFMSVTGERDDNLPSTEDVVKRECQKRVENDKFAQIGAAYDLAHSKGTAHLEEVARLRKIKEQQRASESRQQVRRREWEKRHTKREITKKQTQKNNEKRDRRIAKLQAKANAEAERRAAEAAEAALKAQAMRRAERAAKKEAKAKEAEAKKKTETKDETKKIETKQSTEEETTNDQPVKTGNAEGPKGESPEEKPAQTQPASSEKTEKSTDESSSEKVEATSDDNASGDTSKQESKAGSKDEPEQSKQEAKEGTREETKEEVKEESKTDSEVSKNESKEETKEVCKDESGEDSKDEFKEESKDKSQEDSKDAPKEESKDEPKEESKDEPKEESKDEPKEEPKDESKKDDTEVSKEEPKGASQDKSDAESSESEDEQPPVPPPPPPQVVYDSDGDSSDSPVEDWEAEYSSDDMIRKPRAAAAGPPKTREERYESEDDTLPEPWNAICIVGVRVYSMDEDLELRVVMEGGELVEGGMGKKGEADLDNAQVNAAGEREKQESEDTAAVEVIVSQPTKETEETASEEATVEKKETEKEVEGETKKVDDNGFVETGAVQEQKKVDDESTSKESNEDSKSDKSVDSAEYDKLDSGASTPEVIATPGPTPMESNRELC